MPELITVHEAAAKLKKPVSTVYRWVKYHQIPCQQEGVLKLDYDAFERLKKIAETAPLRTKKGKRAFLEETEIEPEKVVNEALLLLKILVTIIRNEGLDATLLAYKFGRSTRTIKRKIKQLRSLGFSIEYDKPKGDNPGGYRISGVDSKLIELLKIETSDILRPQR